MDIRQRLALNMKRYRAALGWSQERLAHEAEVHRTYVSDLERVARNPSITMLDKLAKPLQVTAADLVREADAEG